MKSILCLAAAFIAFAQNEAYAQDVIFSQFQTPQRLKNMGDGTYAQVVANASAGQAAATSTPCTVSATTSAATPTGCTASGSAGVYVVGGFAPQAGYPIRLVTTGTWTGTIAVGTSIDNCATVNALTVAGQTWGSYTSNVNEAVDVPVTTGGVQYCLSISLSSGTINAALRQ